MVGKFEILYNNGWLDFKTVSLTTGANVVQAGEGILNVVGGPRYLSFDTAISDPRIAYTAATSSPFPIDRIVVTRADRHIGSGVQFIFYSVYPGTAVTKNFATFSETLMGPAGKDYCYVTTTDVSGVSVRGQTLNCAAVGIDLLGLQTLGQTYICKSIQFEHIRPGSVRFSPLPRLSKIKVGRVYFEVVESISLTLDNVPQASLDAIEDGRRIREDAFFIFDDSASVLKDKLYHVVLTGQPTVYSHNGGYSVGLSMARLKDYGNT